MSNLNFYLADGGDWENALIRLTSHPSARNQVVATQDLLPGTVLLRDSALSSVLLASEKSMRCDACFRRAGMGVVLKKCLVVSNTGIVGRTVRTYVRSISVTSLTPYDKY